MSEQISTNETITAPKWAMVTHPEEGTVHCLACGSITDPQVANEEGARHARGCEAIAAITVARDAFYLAEEMGRLLRLGYDAGASATIRRLHGLLPKHLHHADCDGCFAEAQS